MATSQNHLEFSKLVDLVDGSLAPDEGERLHGHLSDCPWCAAAKNRLEQAVKLMRSDTLENAPEYAVATAIAAFQSRPKPDRRLLPRLAAILKFDSLQPAAAFGVRSVISPERQLIFEAGDHEIQLSAVASDGEWIVSGQVLGSCSGGLVELIGNTGSAKAAIDELCEFRIAAVPNGRYTLKVLLNEIELELPGFDLSD